MTASEASPPLLKAAKRTSDSKLQPKVQQEKSESPNVSDLELHAGAGFFFFFFLHSAAEPRETRQRRLCPAEKGAEQTYGKDFSTAARLVESE